MGNSESIYEVSSSRQPKFKARKTLQFSKQTMIRTILYSIVCKLRNITGASNWSHTLTLQPEVLDSRPTGTTRSPEGHMTFLSIATRDIL